jgi:hypothetical protein
MTRTDYTLCGYNVTSWGRGTAYTVERDGRSFYMQGDDAAQLADEMAGDNPEYYLSEYMAALGEPNAA